MANDSDLGESRATFVLKMFMALFIVMSLTACLVLCGIGYYRLEQMNTTVQQATLVMQQYTACQSAYSDRLPDVMPLTMAPANKKKGK